MERGHNGGFNAHRDSHGRYAPAASATRTPHPRATVAHQEGNVRVLQQPIAEQGDEITLTPEDEAILDLIWDQIAAESNPNTVMNTAIRSRARRVPAAPTSEETPNGTATTSD